jgi:LytS/YehU family sensor histidine kinase
MLEFLEFAIFIWNLMTTWRMGVPFVISVVIGMSLYAGIHDESVGSACLVVAMVIGFLIGLIWQITYQKRQTKNPAASGDRPST